ncbi:type II toxin-antitoxin system Phd/YefM family antitoxin [Bdellovibrionota bacterium FG-2]
MTLKPIQLSKDLVTLAEFKDHAGNYLDRVVSSGHPLVITKNGRAAGVVVSPEEYDKIYTQRFMESVAKGVADGDAGRVVSTEELERQLAKRRKARK